MTYPAPARALPSLMSAQNPSLPLHSTTGPSYPCHPRSPGCLGHHVPSGPLLSPHIVHLHSHMLCPVLLNLSLSSARCQRVPSDIAHLIQSAVGCYNKTPQTWGLNSDICFLGSEPGNIIPGCPQVQSLPRPLLSCRYHPLAASSHGCSSVHKHPSCFFL